MKFGPGALPHLFNLPGVGERVAVAMLGFAVKTSPPLGGWQIMAALGIEEPLSSAIV